jgi:hypothetical protein
MTDEERKAEGGEEAIEDLEAPAAAQRNIAGGITYCVGPTCNQATVVSTYCHHPTCSKTAASCQLETAAVVVRAM